MNIKKVLLTVLFTVGLGVVLFIGWFAWAIFSEDQPQFFPLNNSKAKYAIVKSTKFAQGTDENELVNSTSYLSEPRFYVEYRGDGVFMDDWHNNFFRVTVGKSKVELEPFIGKDVIIKQGKFVSSSKQCIVDKCIDIYGPYVVLNIDKLEATK